VHDEPIICAKFLPDGFSLATSSKDDTIKIIDLRNYKTITTIEHDDLSITASNTQFAVSPGGSIIGIGNTRGKVFFFNTLTGKVNDIFDSESLSPIIGMAWDPTHGSRVASIDSSGCMFVWE